MDEDGDDGVRISISTSTNSEYTMTIDPPTPSSMQLQSILLPSPSIPNASMSESRRRRGQNVEWKDQVVGGGGGGGKGKGRAGGPYSPNGSTTTTNGTLTSPHGFSSPYHPNTKSRSSNGVASTSSHPSHLTSSNNADSGAGYTCICGHAGDDGGEAVACDTCDRWCHQFCFGLRPSDVEGEKPWYCWECAPRDVDFASARERMRVRLQHREDERERERVQRENGALAVAGTGGESVGSGRGKRKASPGGGAPGEKKRRTVGEGGKRRRRSSVVHPPPAQSTSSTASHAHTHPLTQSTSSNGHSTNHTGTVNGGKGEGKDASDKEREGGSEDMVDIEESWASSYVHISEDVVGSEEVRRRLHRQAAQWRGVSAFTSPPPPPHHSFNDNHASTSPSTSTNHPSSSSTSGNLKVTLLSPSDHVHPALQPSPTPSPNPNAALDSRPPLFGALTTHPIRKDELVARYASVITPSSVYVGDRLNGYAGMGVPKPYVHLVTVPRGGGVNGDREGGGGWMDEEEREEEDGEEGWALDARMAGNEARFVRSGCKPNAVLRPLLCKPSSSSASGPSSNAQADGEGEALKFGIFATRDLREGEEVVLAWEWDDGNVVRTLPAMVECPGMFSPRTALNHDSQAQIEHARRQIANIVHTLGSTFSTCACGARARDCAFSVFAAFVDGSLPLPSSTSSSSHYPYNPHSTQHPEYDPHGWTNGASVPIPIPTSSGNTTTDDEGVPLPFSLRRKNVSGGVVGAALGEMRGFRARERVPFSGGLGGVEVVRGGGKGKGKQRATDGEEWKEDEMRRGVGRGRSVDDSNAQTHPHLQNSSNSIHTNGHPRIRISDDRDLRPPDPPPEDSTMDVDVGFSPIDFSDEVEPDPVVEEYMPPKMRKKLRSKLLEDLKKSGVSGGGVVVVVDGDGKTVVDSQKLSPEAKPPHQPQPLSASPSSSFAQLSLLTPHPRSVDPIRALPSLPSQADSPSPTPSPAKSAKSRIPVANVRGEAVSPLYPPVPNAQTSGSKPSSPVTTITPKPTYPVTFTLGEDKEEGEVEEPGGDMDVDIDVEVRQASTIPDTPLSPPPSETPVSPSPRASTAGSTPPPPPPLPSSLRTSPKEKREKVEDSLKAPQRKKKNMMDVGSLVNSEASTPNMGAKRELEVEGEGEETATEPVVVVKRRLFTDEPPPMWGESGSRSRSAGAEGGEVEVEVDIKMGEVVESTAPSEFKSDCSNTQANVDLDVHPNDAKPTSPAPPPPPPPPPPKVKLSLKDFAARRKKQKQEEEKHRVDEGVNPPMRPTTASTSALSPTTPTSASTPSTSTFPPTSTNANGMSREVKAEQVQDILMRSRTPDREEGEESEIPGLTMSPRTRALLAAKGSPTSFKAAMQSQGAGVAKPASPVVPAATTLSKLYAPLTSTATAMRASAATPRAGAQRTETKPIAPTAPISPNVASSIPAGTMSVSSALKRPSPPQTLSNPVSQRPPAHILSNPPPTATLTFSNRPQMSSVTPTGPREPARDRPQPSTSSSITPQPTTSSTSRPITSAHSQPSSQSSTTTPSSMWPCRPAPPTRRISVEDDAVSLGDSEDGMMLPPPPHSAASTTSSFASTYVSTPPPTNVGSYASSASFNSASTYRAPTPSSMSNRAPTPSSSSQPRGVPNAPASMRGAQQAQQQKEIPDGPRRGSVDTPRLPTGPQSLIYRPPSQPNAQPSSASRAAAVPTGPAPAASTNPPKKLPTGPAMMRPAVPQNTGAQNGGSLLRLPSASNANSTMNSTRPIPSGPKALSGSSSTIQQSAGLGPSSSPAPYLPPSYSQSQPQSQSSYSQPQSQTQGQSNDMHSRRGSTNTPPLSASSGGYESRPGSSRDAYSRYDRDGSIGPPNDQGWTRPPSGSGRGRSPPGRDRVEEPRRYPEHPTETNLRFANNPWEEDRRRAAMQREQDERDREAERQMQERIMGFSRTRGVPPPTAPRAPRAQRMAHERQRERSMGRGGGGVER